ncbi:MAG: PIN domain-containing protein [Deltaproteobacteria bacterium]|nr:PIN domain-containing protein [Deltaproteobacteria bacterium]
MTGKVFLDTNVLVYAMDDDEPAKQARARALISAASAESHVVSPQVLQEFYNAVTRKLARPVPVDAAAQAVRVLARLTVVPADAALVLAAIDLHRRHQVSLWDALVMQAALTAGCERLLTEDLQDGFRLAGLTVENPFRGLS